MNHGKASQQAESTDSRLGCYQTNSIDHSRESRPVSEVGTGKLDALAASAYCILGPTKAPGTCGGADGDVVAGVRCDAGPGL